MLWETQPGSEYRRLWRRASEVVETAGRQRGLFSPAKARWVPHGSNEGWAQVRERGSSRIFDGCMMLVNVTRGFLIVVPVSHTSMAGHPVGRPKLARSFKAVVSFR